MGPILPTTLLEIGGPHCSVGNPWIATTSEVWLLYELSELVNGSLRLELKHSPNVTFRSVNIDCLTETHFIVEDPFENNEGVRITDGTLVRIFSFCEKFSNIKPTYHNKTSNMAM